MKEELPYKTEDLIRAIKLAVMGGRPDDHPDIEQRFLRLMGIVQRDAYARGRLDVVSAIREVLFL